MDLVIKNGTLVTAAVVFQADLGIEGERIVAIGRDLRGREVIDAAGCYVIPGAVDPHVHFCAPVGSAVSSDDWESGTMAAACGGTSTVIDFAESGRGRSLSQTLHARLSEAEGQAAIDYALHVSVLDAEPATLAEIPDLIAAGCPSFKLYMAYEGIRLDDDELFAVLQAIARHGGLPLVHAENHGVITHLTAQLLSAGHTAPRYHALAHPPEGEAEAVNRALTLAALAGAPLYVVHLSCAQALAPLIAARQRGQPVYGETCPQYLLLSADLLDAVGFEGARFVMAPPLRARADQEALWLALVRGDLEVVATDHCPFYFEGQKSLGRDDFSQIPGGIPGVETRLPLLYTFGVAAGRFSLTRWVEVCCTAPARRFGLAPRKGTLAVGADADVVVFDPQRRVTLSATNLHSRTDYCPYEGWEVCGYPRHVLSRGRLIVEDGQFVGEPGWGRFLRRHYHYNETSAVFRRRSLPQQS